MNVEDLKNLAAMMAENGLTLLEWTSENEVLRLERNPLKTATACIPADPMKTAESPVAAPDSPKATAAVEAPPARPGSIVTSPMVGVFYAAQSPESDPYVQVGDRVKKGDVLCIIEAMKLMNEIQSEVDGTIVEITVGNGQVVEYDQPLFRIQE